MRFLLSTRRLLAAALMLSAALLSFSVCAQTRSTPLFAADREACFGRAYDRTHLASHPNQKVTSIYILRSLSERKEAENWQPDQREQAIKTFRERGGTEVKAFVTFRDRRGYFHNSLTCNKEDRSGVHCYIECDGGSFTLKRESANSVLLNNEGFVLVGGCGEEVEDDQRVYFEPGRDDKMFRLESKSVAICRAEERKAKPIRSGRPPRERFKEDETFCFGRDYDAAHLASHPRQLIAKLRVGRLDPAKEKEDDPDSEWWWQRVKLDVSLTRKSGATTTVHYACSPQEASWECQRELPGEGRTACNDRSIHLVRGPENDILIFNRKSGLPIDNECETKDSSQYSESPPTRSGDRIFRLSRMPIEACR